MKQLMIQMKFFMEITVKFFLAVFHIAGKGMSLGGKMGADLMGPSGDQAHTQKRHMTGMSQRFIARFYGLGIFYCCF